MNCQLIPASPSAKIGTPTLLCNTVTVYRVNANSTRTLRNLIAALLDRGANGCVIGPNMHVGYRTTRYIDLIGLRDHTVQELNIAEGLAVVKSQQGNIIIHIRQGAVMSDGRTILSSLQLEAFGCSIVDKAPMVNDNAQPHIRSPEGYIIPLSIEQGLPILEMRPPTDLEMESLTPVSYTHLTLPTTPYV